MTAPSEKGPMLLEAHLARVHELQKFAEAKNVALMTFSSAALVAIISLTAETATPDAWLVAGLVAGGPLFLSAVLSIGSLIPQFRPRNSTDKSAERANLLHFEAVRSIPLSGAADQILARYVDANGFTAAYADDLGRQIVINSQIARWKFVLSDWSASFVIAAFVLGLATIVTAGVAGAPIAR